MQSERAQPRDALRRFARARCFVAPEIVEPAARMRIDHAEALVLFLQMRDQRHQRQMLDDIGEIAGMVGVAIIHLGNRRGRCSNSPPQLGQRPLIASVQALQNVHS